MRCTHAGYLALGLVLGFAAGCPRLAVDHDDYHDACASYCDKRVACLDLVPWDIPDPPADADECTQRCVASPPSEPACVEADTAYSACLGELTCEQLQVFSVDPFAAAARELCFEEFEESSYCE